jgi:hypothetical protein
MVLGLKYIICYCIWSKVFKYINFILKINYKYSPTYIWYAASNNHGNDVAASLFTKVMAPST